VIVEGVPVVAGDAALEHDEEHADDDEELLHVPDLGGDVVVFRMVGDPGVEEKDKRPDDESGDDGVLADAFARETKLEDDGDGEVEKEESVVGGVAVERKGDGEPHGHPRKDLAENQTPAFAELPRADEDKGTDDSKDEADSDGEVEGRGLADIEAVQGENDGEGQCIDDDVGKR